MVQNVIISFLLILFSGLFALVFGQDSMKPTMMSGDVTAISETTIGFTTAKGPIEAIITDKTDFKRISAVNPNTKDATPSAIGDIKTGDKIIVSGFPAADGKTIPALRVYLMSRSDIDQKNAKETEEWKLRGIAGKVTSINPANFTVQISGLMGSTSMVVTPKADARFLHYAPNSVKYQEAKASSITDIEIGDMIRAVGDKSADGAAFTAEKVLIGSFVTVAGTIKTVDAEKNEVTIKDLSSGKDITISTANVTTFKKFPAEMAERMAGMQAGGGARPAGGATPPANGGGSTAGGGRQGGFGGGGRAGGGVDEMLDRFPTITTADLKPGDMIAVSSSKGSTPDHIQAFKLLAGVEPFLRMAKAASGGNRGRGVQGDFTIPGLDGIGF